MHNARKRFGQNFLVDKNIIERIISTINPQEEDHIVEIGPGLGALTEPLLKTTSHLEVIELDRDLALKLAQRYSSQKKITVHQTDALYFDFSQLCITQKKLRIVGNLPYNIATPLIFHLLDQATNINDMHFMLQKEVVDRLTAKVGTHAYGRLTIMVQYHAEVTSLFTVPSSAFIPQPKVESAIVRITPYFKSSFNAINFQRFSFIVREAFNHRRKTLRNSLHTFLTASELMQIGILPHLRPEQLTLDQFLTIEHYLSTRIA